MVELIGYATVFALTFLVTGGTAALAWVLLDRAPSSDAASSRQPSILRHEVLSTLSFLSMALARFPLAGRLKTDLSEAGVNWSVGRTVLMMLVAGGVALNVCLLLGFVPWYMAVGAAGFAAAAPLVHIRRRRAQRLQAVEEQLPEALDYLSRALVSGHSLPMSLELVAEEVRPPLSAELRKAVDEYNLGMSMQDALDGLARRAPSMDMQFLVSAVLTQSRTGGTLHEVLDGLAETIRERSTLKGQVRAMTANGRMTAVILSLLPVFVAAVMFYINPRYFNLLLDHPFGKPLVFLAIAGQLSAYFVIRRIVDIKV